MEILFAFLAGLLTLINPCVLPVLPIVLASAIQAGRHGPLAVAVGMSSSFVLFGMTVATVGQSIGLTESVLSKTGSIAMIVFGLVLLIPRFNEVFSLATAGLSRRADSAVNGIASNSLTSQLLSGFLLGAVWSPCIGPTLGGAIALASQGQSLVFVFFIMLSFAAGVSVVILLLGYGTGEVIKRRQAKLRKLATNAKPIMGFSLLIVGVMLFFELHYYLEALMINVLPIWLQDLSVRF